MRKRSGSVRALVGHNIEGDIIQVILAAGKSRAAFALTSLQSIIDVHLQIAEAHAEIAHLRAQQEVNRKELAVARLRTQQI